MKCPYCASEMAVLDEDFYCVTKVAGEPCPDLGQRYSSEEYCLDPRHEFPVMYPCNGHD